MKGIFINFLYIEYAIYVSCVFLGGSSYYAISEKKILFSSVFSIGSLEEAIISIIDYLLFNGKPLYSGPQEYKSNTCTACEAGHVYLAGEIHIFRCEYAFRAWHAAKLLTQHATCSVLQLAIIVGLVDGSSARAKGSLQSLVARKKYFLYG